MARRRRRSHLKLSPGADSTFDWVRADDVSDEDLAACARLFSKHYGVWSPTGPHPGEPIRLSAETMRKEFASPNSWVAIGRDSKRDVVAYASAVRFTIQGAGPVTWVTRLVVDARYRKMLYATRLLGGIWSFSDHYCWGLVTPNPYAVRALEKATRRRCDTSYIARLGPEVLEAAQPYVPYLRNVELQVGEARSSVNTKFFVSHNGLTEMIRQASDSEPWRLGNLGSGREWFAATFREQAEHPLTRVELDVLLSDADAVAKRAYQGMSLDQHHRWMQHTYGEVDFIVERLGVRADDLILDFGSGNGRHALEMARRGYRVVGVDFAPTLAQRARDRSEAEGLSHRIQFLDGDCRDIRLDQQFDPAICLYDVVGTFPSNDDNQAILENLMRHLKPGGYALITVMNFTSTMTTARNIASVFDEPQRLLDLAPSRTMQDTGQIFDPELCVVDRDSRTVFRKEQFDAAGHQLPAELIVRDRRFSVQEIIEMARYAGLQVHETRVVSAGDWARNLAEDDARGREILVIAQRPSV